MELIAGLLYMLWLCVFMVAVIVIPYLAIIGLKEVMKGKGE